MEVLYPVARDLTDACLKLISDVKNYVPSGSHRCFSYELLSFDERNFFLAVRGTYRVAFKSRDRDFALCGLSAADLITADLSSGDDIIKKVIARAASLDSGQYYFGATRFDEHGGIATEWCHFGRAIFVLPLLMVRACKGQKILSLNYRHDGHLTLANWRDASLSLLQSFAINGKKAAPNLYVEMGAIKPLEHEYCMNIKKALSAFSKHHHHRKVVMGRRRTVAIKNTVDPVELFFRLKKKSKNAFLFFLDNGRSQAFFGGSPELLYRRIHRHVETESLAGTRPRALVESDDQQLRTALLNSFKDQREHAFVCTHIEERLKDLGARDVFSSSLDVMELPYVLHLVKRYQATISPDVDDATILATLHPTPAVCGSDARWARDFIRAYEGFDRGFYAGPIGYIGKLEAEFAVAIRSALFNEQALYIYAASGIVPGSIPEQEWDELNNKEKNILSIFDEGF